MQTSFFEGAHLQQLAVILPTLRGDYQLREANLTEMSSE